MWFEVNDRYYYYITDTFDKHLKRKIYKKALCNVKFFQFPHSSHNLESNGRFIQTSIYVQEWSLKGSREALIPLAWKLIRDNNWMPCRFFWYTGQSCLLYDWMHVCKSLVNKAIWTSIGFELWLWDVLINVAHTGNGAGLVA